MITRPVEGTGMTDLLPGAAGAAEPPGLVELYHAHRLGMVRLAVLLVDDLATAEDVVQDAFAALHQRWDRLNDVNSAIGYLRTCVVNAARSVLRRRRTARLYTAPDERAHESAEAEAMLAAEHEEVLVAVRRLPRRQREVLILRYWSDLSEVEIAETLGVSRGTVKSTASRGLAALAGLLEVPE
ncbi:MAG TPA: SigE family RNA polymerase sigma factor [Mycobacteriales bacterium]|nr:SigE family RNA polymerase sigma factor [Mycobacteriales bacterium]